jgi:protein arginine N-methyltransferase 1
VRKSGLDDRIECIRGDAATVRLPDKVDVMLGDVIGVFGLEGGVLRIYPAFRTSNLAADGRVVPERLDLFLAPWEAPSEHAEVGFWRRDWYGLDLSAVARIQVNIPLSRVLDPAGALAKEQSAWSGALADSHPEYVEASARFEIACAGTMHGLAGWVETRLAENVRIHTGPDRPTTVWRQGWLPIEHPVEVLPQDVLEATVVFTPEEGGPRMGWRGRVVRNGKEVASFSQHEFLGRLVPGDLPK